MNTAVKAVVTGALSWPQFGQFKWQVKQWMVVVLMLGIVASCFGIVYMKDANRRLFIQYQSLQQQQQQYKETWGKLLLEQSTWDRQSRIQGIAQKKLNMVYPSQQSIQVISVASH